MENISPKNEDLVVLIWEVVKNHIIQFQKDMENLLWMESLFGTENKIKMETKNLISERIISTEMH